MAWKRLDSATVARTLRAEWSSPDGDGAELARKALEHLRDQLLGGRYVAVQDHLGETFIGTPEEAAERMMDDG